MRTSRLVSLITLTAMLLEVDSAIPPFFSPCKVCLTAVDWYLTSSKKVPLHIAKPWDRLCSPSIIYALRCQAIIEYCIGNIQHVKYTLKDRANVKAVLCGYLNKKRP
ncbi:unnamed protein product [Calicophoron daubneyi]|uniref:Saposin B-type domain-containing protein n=1 Tax=Calicophoron daubneyi TaxID=300641 RepID=A0AAV2TTB3_CALDB